MRAQPYRTPSPESIIAGPWQASNELLGSALPGWDYQSQLTVSRSVDVDLARARREAGLGQDAILAVHVRAWSTSSWVRHNLTTLEMSGGSTEWVSTTVEATLHGTNMTQEIVIETCLVLLSSAEAAHAVAKRPGSVLWRDTHRVNVEGGGGLMPLAPVDFETQGLPAQAAWYLSLDTMAWDSPAMGNLLVLLNVGNGAIAAALGRSSVEPADSVLWDSLMIDFVHDLVMRALEDEEFFPVESRAADEPSEISSAALVTNLVRAFLLNPGEALFDGVVRLRDLHRRDPSKTRALIQSSLRFPRAS